MPTVTFTAAGGGRPLEIREVDSEVEGRVIATIHLVAVALGPNSKKSR